MSERAGYPVVPDKLFDHRDQNYLLMKKILLLLIVTAGFSLCLAAINANSLGHINQNTGYPGTDSNIPPLKWVDGPGEGEIVEQ